MCISYKSLGLLHVYAGILFTCKHLRKDEINDCMMIDSKDWDDDKHTLMMMIMMLVMMVMMVMVMDILGTYDHDMIIC